MQLNQEISCIIPAYNEEKNILEVLKVVYAAKWIDEIIVVDDGSTDSTVDVVNKFNNIKLIVHKENLGKGAAMVSGAKVAKSDLILFLDADLINLTETHLLRIISPIAFTKEADLVIGVFAIKHLNINGNTKIANRTFPAISGQRAIWKKDLPELDKLARARYGADWLITKSVAKKRKTVVKLDDLSQVTKEKKDGDFVKIIKARARMYKEIMAIWKKD